MQDQTKTKDELYWRTQPEWRITQEQIRRFEVWFTKRRGYDVKWCPVCRRFEREHFHTPSFKAQSV